MDGLLLDSERLYTQAFTDACAEHNESVSGKVRKEAWLSCIGTTEATSRRIISESFGPDFPIDSVLRRSRERFNELQAGGIDAKPGVAEILRQLAQWRLPVGLVTSTRRTTTGLKLYRARLGDYFHVRVCGGEASAGKPSPEPYLMGARLLGVNPEDCLVLEDSANGVRAGVAAGAQVIQIPDQVPPSREILELGHTVHENLHQTLETLRRSRNQRSPVR